MDLSVGFVEDSMQRYFDSLKDSTEKDIVQIAEDVWSWIKAYIEDYYDGKRTLEEPNTCPGENNNFMFVWRDSNWYLELELFTNGTGEWLWFCKELEDGKMINAGYIGGEDWVLYTELSDDMMEWLFHFTTQSYLAIAEQEYAEYFLGLDRE